MTLGLFRRSRRDIVFVGPKVAWGYLVLPGAPFRSWGCLCLLPLGGLLKSRRQLSRAFGQGPSDRRIFIEVTVILVQRKGQNWVASNRLDDLLVVPHRSRRSDSCRIP